MRQHCKGEFVGAFELYWRHPRQATPWDADYADHIVQSAAIIIAHATEAIRRETAEAALSDELETMRALHNLSTIALGGGELTPVLEAALDATMTFLAADFGNIQLYDPATETLRIAVQRGFDQPFLDHFSHVDAHGSSACGLALADRRRRIVTDTETDPDFAPHRAAAREAGYRSVQSTPLFSASGEVLGMLSTHFRSCRLLTDLDEQMTDLFAREVARAIDRIRHQTALRESEARFQQFAKASSGGLWIRDAETLIMEYISPAMTTIYGIGQDILLGHLDQWVTSILPEDRSLALKHIEHARKGEATVHDFRIQRATDQAFRWIRNTDFPLFDEHGKVQRIGGIAEDITDAKLAIEHQGVLLAELQHRVRNILAMIRSTIRQTSRNKTNLDEFICQLMGRLDAMARTQAMLSRSPSPQVDLEEIVREELLAQTAQNELCSLRGQPVWLPPKAAEVLTLGFHELAANSVKFGVLGKGSGNIAVTWRRERKDRDWVTILWQETGIHPLVSDAVPGFGTELITQLLPYELEGEAVMEFSTNGLKVRMGFPLAQGTSVFQTDAYGYGEPWV